MLSTRNPSLARVCFADTPLSVKVQHTQRGNEPTIRPRTLTSSCPNRPFLFLFLFLFHLVVQTWGYLLRCFEGEGSGLSHLDLSRCGLTAKHLSLLPKYGKGVFRKLVLLNVHGNHFGDNGAVYLSDFLGHGPKYSKPVAEAPLLLSPSAKSSKTATEVRVVLIRAV